jgi:uncharacterized phage protein (TIGR01671 family)
MIDWEFRAWDKDANQMLEVEGIDFKKKLVITYWDRNYADVTFNNFILMPYVGRKDNDGKKIFVGDILKFAFGSMALSGTVKQLDDGRFCLFYKDGTEYPLYAIGNCHVIGNIYQGEKK